MMEHCVFRMRRKTVGKMATIKVINTKKSAGEWRRAGNQLVSITTLFLVCPLLAPAAPWYFYFMKLFFILKSLDTWKFIIGRILLQYTGYTDGRWPAKVKSKNKETCERYEELECRESRSIAFFLFIQDFFPCFIGLALFRWTLGTRTCFIRLVRLVFFLCQIGLKCS